MKTMITSTLILLGTISSAFAGHGVGNGGGAHVCRNADGSIRSIELYDLYEARKRYGWESDTELDGTDVEEILKKVDTKLRANNMASFAAKITAAIALTRYQMRPAKNAKLFESLDAQQIMLDPGCNYEQIVNWDDRTNFVLFKEELFNGNETTIGLDAKNQAALLLHEAVYWLARAYDGHDNSDDTREFIARIFSVTELKTSLLKNFQVPGLKRAVQARYYSNPELAHTLSILYTNWESSQCYNYIHPETANAVNVSMTFRSYEGKSDTFLRHKVKLWSRKTGLQKVLLGETKNIIVYAIPARPSHQEALPWGSGFGISSSVFTGRKPRLFDFTFTKLNCQDVLKFSADKETSSHYIVE